MHVDRLTKIMRCVKLTKSSLCLLLRSDKELNILGIAAQKSLWSLTDHNVMKVVPVVTGASCFFCPQRRCDVSSTLLRGLRLYH
jgi:hypothetical protein